MLAKPVASCAGCAYFQPPLGSKNGFLTVDGDGSSGVMVVGDHLGRDDLAAGSAFVGKSGHYLWNSLNRVGVNRDTLRVATTIFCMPPDAKLLPPFAQPAIDHCRPNLDSAITDARNIAIANGKTFVIVALGQVAFMRLLGLDAKQASSLLKEDYYGYPFWSMAYKAWIVACDRPLYYMSGKHHEAPVMQFVFKRALEIADGGLKLTEPPYLLDPDPMTFSAWVDDYLKVANDPNVFLSYDIETPYKKGKSEDQIAKEDGEDYTILRCAFAYQPGMAVSVPWSAAHHADFLRLFTSTGSKLGWNSDVYDRPRVEHNIGTRIKGDHLDGMLAWHVLNSALPKGLGFVTPFYVQDTSMWKHLSSAEPAFYNAKDADMALRIWLGVREDLKLNKLWHVFDRHVIQLNRVYEFMSARGVGLDLGLRQAAEDKLTAILNEQEANIASVIPLEVLQLKPFAKVPKEITAILSAHHTNQSANPMQWQAKVDEAIRQTGLIEINGIRKTTKCPFCSTLDVKADHYKSVGKKKLASGTPENECVGCKSIKVTIPSKQWAKPLPFKLSNQALQRYQRHFKHKPILTPKERKITFDDKAITRLVLAHPNDPLYPLISDFRATQKLLSTYVGRTAYIEVEVPDDYTLQPREKYAV